MRRVNEGLYKFQSKESEYLARWIEKNMPRIIQHDQTVDNSLSIIEYALDQNGMDTKMIRKEDLYDVANYFAWTY